MDTAFFFEALETCLKGAPLTIFLSIVSLFFGGLFSMLLASMRLSNIKFLDWVARIYVFVIRGTPLLVQIFIVYYGFGQFRNFLQDIGLWWFFKEPIYCAIFSLSLSTAAYTSEIFRGAVQAIPHGQIEAANSFGMSKLTLFLKIIAPLALRESLPAYSNEVTLLIKATSLASLITITEVTFQAQKLISETYHVTEIFIIAGSIYLIINIIVTQGFQQLERRLAYDRIQQNNQGRK